MAQKNYFELLNQPQTFAVDSLSLQKAKTLLLARLHPDRFVNAGPVEKRLAEQMSVQVNEAYQTLSDDIKRALYLCELNGVNALAERAMAPEFLEKQLTWRAILDDDETSAALIADARENEQAEDETSEPVRASIIEEIGREQDKILQRVAKALDVDHDTKAAAAATRELMFVSKLLTQIPH